MLAVGCGMLSVHVVDDNHLQKPHAQKELVRSCMWLRQLDGKQFECEMFDERPRTMCAMRGVDKFHSAFGVVARRGAHQIRLFSQFHFAFVFEIAALRPCEVRNCVKNKMKNR